MKTRNTACDPPLIKNSERAPINHVLERGSTVFGCLLDVRKALYTVWTDCLLYKLLFEFGIIQFSIYKSFINSKTFSSMVKANHKSQRADVACHQKPLYWCKRLA